MLVGTCHKRDALVGIAHLWLIGAALLLLGCGADAPASKSESKADEPWFRDIAADSGLTFTHFNGMSGEFYIAEIMGGGCALFDYDNDGDLDVYLVQGAMVGPGKSPADAIFPPPPDEPLTDRLYRNDLSLDDSGKPVLRFTDVSAEAGLSFSDYGMGVAAGDYNNDGWVDLYITNYGPNRLLRNNGDGSFSDQAAVNGLDVPDWSVSAAFLDFDHDGWLDLYVGNYLDFDFETHKPCFKRGPEYCHPLSYAPVPDRLFRNRGDGSFEDVSESSGIGLVAGNGLGVVAADFDGNGWLDIYVANDGEANFLWLNQGAGRFREAALLSGCALNEVGEPEASMGIDAADFDGDGDEDLFMTHLAGETNTIYVNNGRGLFEDRSIQTGLGLPSKAFTGFGAAWFDYDNDGWLDLLTVNGAVTTIAALRERGDPFPMHQPNQLFRNQEGRKFVEVTQEAGAVFELSEVGRGSAFGDVDNDGDVDVLITNNSGSVRLLENRIGNRNHWLGLRLVDGARGRDMLGARVEVLPADQAPLIRRVRAAASYASANDPRVLVGLGSRGGSVTVRVQWPDGAKELWTGLEVDRWHLLSMGKGASPKADGPNP